MFDPVGGASGDMILGSLIHLGCPPDYLASIWGTLPVFRGVSKNMLRVSERKIHGIAALNPQFFFQDAANHFDPTPPCPGTAESRSFRNIMDMLEHAPLPNVIRNRAIGIFTCLAKAEGAVHHVTPESVHFHEIGALDSILDIVGVAAAVEWFHPDTIFTRPPPLGHGITSSMHGPIPLPAPATVNLLHDMRVRLTDIEGELTTPTGAAILKFLAQEVPPLCELTIEGAGYGCGTRTFENWPNFFRSLLCSIQEISADENVIVVETDVDDMIPEDW
ncbi:MAG: LarC family nickel insertion protein, partial [Syntrophales bacterium]